MMMSKRWFRFGLPLGSAAIVAAMLDTVMGVYWLMNDLGSSLYFHWWDHQEPVDQKSVINISLISSRVGLAFSLWIFILLKQRIVLVLWIPLSVISDVLFIAHAIFSHPRDFVADEIWICNIFSLFLFRCYITAVLFQTLVRILRNERLRNETVVFTTTNNNSSLSPQASSLSSPTEETPANDIPSFKYHLVEPIGKKCGNFINYFDNKPRLGAAVLVVFEIAWNMFVLSTHVMTEFLMGGRLFFLHKEEEIIMRIWRILIDSVALFFIVKKRKSLLRFWLVVYFWSLFITICLTIWTVTEWTFETPLVVVLVICFSGLSDIILRFGVLYFCLMLSLQITISVSRTHSLKSETRSLQLQRHSNPTTHARTIPIKNAGETHTLAERTRLTRNHF